MTSAREGSGPRESVGGPGEPTDVQHRRSGQRSPGQPWGFRAPWWCRNRHLQTIWGPLLRPNGLAFRRERVTTPDGDFVDLDWLEGPSDAPRLLVLHGLEGSARSHYVGGLSREASARGWAAVALNFRSCSGDLNRRPHFYHSGETGDLAHVVELLVARRPAAPLGLVGVSLGANVLLKWLGERENDLPEPIVGAVAISTPFDLAACARVLDRGMRRLLYTASFLWSLRRKVRRKAAVYPGFVDLGAAEAARTFAAYDRAVTAPLHGFRDEHDYWSRASSGPYLGRIRRPTLLISALDDPFVPLEVFPDPAHLPPAVSAEFQPEGGHAGFIDGRWPWRVGSWAERRALEFLDALLPQRVRA